MNPGEALVDIGNLILGISVFLPSPKQIFTMQTYYEILYSGYYELYI